MTGGGSKAGPFRDWVLVLGAGASVAAPTCLPAFPALARGTLGGIGWSYRNGYWRKKGFPAFADPGRVISPEVLFGALQAFDVRFAPAIAERLGTDKPNAAHRVAAAVLERGGMVWTTNIDLAVEGACIGRGLPVPSRYGRQAPAPARRPPSRGSAPVTPSVLAPLREAGPGGLVKFHGTAEEPGSLAFADRDLMTPLPDADVEYLVRLVGGKTLVFYGYAGADADLADLLEQAIGRAAQMLWFEPSPESRAAISLAFPGAEHSFQPLVLPSGGDVPATARAFLRTARRAGYPVNDTDRPKFTDPQQWPPDPQISVGPVPGILSARLIERFGSHSEELHALLAALAHDLARRRWRLLPAYARWALSRSMYGHGTAEHVVSGLARFRRLLMLPGIRRIGHGIVRRQFAILLTAGRWQEVEDLARWSLRCRRQRDGTQFPADYYYRAHARRYEFRPAEAGQDAQAAIGGLADARDPERLAGALFEAGAAAIYQGQFDIALRRAFELQYRRGRYAIRRWQSWGGWLEAIAYCHLRDPQAAADAISRAADRFDDEGYEGALADLDTASLLAERVRRAIDPARAGDPVPAITPRNRTRRQQDDLDLIIGDLELACNTADGLARARRHYQDAAARRSCPVAARLADLGLAEVTRREGHAPQAADTFAAIAADARSRSATWLEAQAICGLNLTDPARAQPAWQDLSQRWPHAPASVDDLVFGHPRILWTITI